MLWKLADNVKYEDDCEVSFGEMTVKFDRILTASLSTTVILQWYYTTYFTLHGFDIKTKNENEKKKPICNRGKKIKKCI